MDARKSRIRGREVLALLDGIDEIVVAARRAGSTAVRQPLGKRRPDDEALLGLLLGPTGNLRAPTVRVGRKLVVGFDEATYREVLE